MKHVNRIEPHVIRQISVLAEVSPPTVIRFLRGKPLRPLSRSRIARALRALKLDLRAPRRAA